MLFSFLGGGNNTVVLVSHCFKKPHLLDQLSHCESLSFKVDISQAGGFQVKQQVQLEFPGKPNKYSDNENITQGTLVCVGAGREHGRDRAQNSDIILRLYGRCCSCFISGKCASALAAQPYLPCCYPYNSAVAADSMPNAGESTSPKPLLGTSVLTRAND